MKLHLALALVATSGCSSSEPGDAATLGGLTYLVPSGWSSKDLSTRQRPMFEWTPTDNEHKEALDVFRVERIALAKTAGGQIDRLLVEAQQKLQQGKFSAPTHFTTRNGM